MLQAHVSHFRVVLLFCVRFRNHVPNTKECARAHSLGVSAHSFELHALRLGICTFLQFCLFAKPDFFQNGFNVCKKVRQKFYFMGEILNEARQRILNGESQRKVAAALGTKKN
jgi:hypothetical protein